MGGSAKNYLIEAYKLESPDAIQQEDDDGTYYPKKIPIPAIAYIPPAEPRVFITDVYDDPKDWYDIHQLIEEFANQSYVSYYNGLYFASFNLSISCLELVLKYELLRTGKLDPSKLDKGNFGLHEAITKIDDLNLGKFKKRLTITKEVRNGMFHYNPKKLRPSLISIRKRLFSYSTEKKSPPAISLHAIIESHDSTPLDDIDDGDFLPGLSYLLDNIEWSKIAFFTYKLMYDITKKLYGKSNQIKYLKEALDDYHQRKK